MVDAVTTPTRAQIAQLVGNDQRLILAMEQLFISALDVVNVQANIATIQQDITTLQGNVVDIDADIAVLQADVAALQVDTYGSLYMLANATATTFAAIDTPAKVLGTTTAGLLDGFTHADNRLTYSGPDRIFRITSLLNYTGTTAETFSFYIALNGGVVLASEMPSATGAGTTREGVNLQALVTLTTGDFIEVWAENTTSGNPITVTDLQLVANNV